MTLSALVPAAVRPAVAIAPAPLAPRASEERETPYRRLKDSPPGRFVRENKLLTAGAVVAGSIVLAGAADRWPVVADVARYGILPAAGAGIATVGVLAAHDALVNDLGSHNWRAAGKIAGGTAAALGGAQMVGAAYEIPVLDEALTGTLEKVFEHGQALLGVGVAGGGVAAGAFAARRFQAALASPERRALNLALGTGAATASAAGILGGVEMVGRRYALPGADRALTATVRTLAGSSVAAAAGGALLMAGAGVLASEAAGNFRRGGNDLLTAAEGMGAVTAGLGGAELAGHGLGVEALRGALTHHADTVGSVALTAFGAALARASGRNVRKNGLRPWNALGLAAGGAMIPGGLAAGAATFGLEKAAELGLRGAGVAAGAGLGAAAFALGRQSVEQARQARPGAAALSAVGAAGAATGSLLVTGEALGIEAVSRLGREVAEHTLVPLWDHVLEPTATFLFEHPIAGGVLVAAGVAAAIVLSRRSGEEKPAA